MKKIKVGAKYFSRFDYEKTAKIILILLRKTFEFLYDEILLMLY